jgi:hypothetical protein
LVPAPWSRAFSHRVALGLLVLFRTNSNVRQNVAVTAFVYSVGVVVGLIVSASGILF